MPGLNYYDIKMIFFLISIIQGNLKNINRYILPLFESVEVTVAICSTESLIFATTVFVFFLGNIFMSAILRKIDLIYILLLFENNSDVKVCINTQIVFFDAQKINVLFYF